MLGIWTEAKALGVDISFGTQYEEIWGAKRDVNPEALASVEMPIILRKVSLKVSFIIYSDIGIIKEKMNGRNSQYVTCFMGGFIEA
jgi:hypothetical protein